MPNNVFLTQRDHFTCEVTASVGAHTRPAQDQSRQNLCLGGGGLMKFCHQPRSYRQLMGAEVGDSVVFRAPG